MIKKNNKLYEASRKLGKRRIKGNAGVMLGYYRNKTFWPTKYFLENNKRIIRNYVIIDSKTEFLFTCGRDLFKKSIKCKKGSGLLVVFNTYGEVLGIVREQKKIYKNILNIGLFLKEDELEGVIF